MKLVTLKADSDVQLFPIGDVQYGPPACDINGFQRWIDYAMSHKNPKFIGTGDYIDLGSPSNRNSIVAEVKRGNLYDTIQQALDMKSTEFLNTVKDILKPTQGKWLGLVEGHHYWEYEDGTTTDEEMANYLGCEFLGTSGIVTMKFPRIKNTTPSCSIWLHHGRGGGASIAGPITQLEKMLHSFDADIYLIGHHHKKIATKVQKLYASSAKRLAHKDVILACTGSWLKGYMENSSTYVEKGMMSPAALGGIKIDIKTEDASVDMSIVL